MPPHFLEEQRKMNDEFQKMRRALEQVPWNDGWLPCNMASA
jgi:hypothetical protein